MTMIQTVFKNEDVTLASVGPMDPSVSNRSTRETTRYIMIPNVAAITKHTYGLKPIYLYEVFRDSKNKLYLHFIKCLINDKKIVGKSSSHTNLPKNILYNFQYFLP